MWVKIQAGAEQATIAQIRNLYKKFNPGLTFEFKFLDEDFQVLYEAENRVAILSRYFAAIAIIISCLGLFGLVAFTAQKRQKEIGIRKVLGSSEFGIFYLVSSDFTKSVIAANVIALPVSYLITKNWLDGFAYRIDLEIWYFAGAALVTLAITLLTVGAQAIRAATANPVGSLRYE
jgi:ABC-type antimicrobial peptide transport system permease subunit